MVNDGSATTPITCFSEQAHTMTRNVNEVVAKLSDKNPYILPPNLQQLEGTTHIFQFHFDFMTSSRRPDFVLDRVFPTTILSLPLPESVEVPPESSTVPDIQKTPTLIQTPTSQIITPPPPVTETNIETPLSKDPADKKNTDSKVARTSTKKVPFHDKPDTSSSLLDQSGNTFCMILASESIKNKRMMQESSECMTDSEF
ncbi:hypothetical protein Tco_1003192 [Tanacetum coccineum]|uniref:Uncharacterized protein n=1 Tax=Tanacetum coccineum TaxID=301880 RepID=A0ABQ5F9H9_9ASTR